jgi:uncharacterized metal-binding protein YceD (DUF177 family)
VNNRQNPLRLNVGYLYNKPIGSLREVPVEVENIEIDDLTARDLRSHIRISRTREGLLLQVTAEAEVLTTCSRCLETFYLPVSAEFEELYQFPSRHREETDLILPNDGYLDMSSIYREYLILSMPIKRLCHSNCAGLCVECGVNLNETTCEHHPKSGAHPAVIEREEPV